MTGENIVSGVVNTVSAVTNTVKDTVTRLDPTRWQGYSHEELYRMLQDGPGATASALPTQRWTEIAATMTDIDANLRGALTRSADGWRGPAASTAIGKLTGLANWADTTGQNATAMRDATQRQAENVAKARADMPAPTKLPSASPDPTAAPAMQLLSLQGDQERADAAASAGEQSAHDVMTTYQLNTEATVEALGTFAAPERIAPQSGHAHHGNVHGVGVTTPSGLIDGLLGITGLDGHKKPNQHAHQGGGNTSSSNASWHSENNNGGPRFSSPGEPSGNRYGYGYSPVFSGYGGDRDENRRSGGGPGRPSTPGGGGTVNPIEVGTGNGINTGNGGGSFHGTLGGPTPSTPTPNAAVPGAHVAAGAGANPAASILNPNEMPPPAAAPNGTMTSAAGAPGAAGATSAQGAGADKLLGRRGFDLGQGATSSSWLAEPEPATPSSVRNGPARRRDFKAQARVTERVQVDGKDVDLPEQVIGDR